MWREQTVSVIFPTYNEKESIRDAIEDFFACEHVDEIVVVNNNAAEGTDAEVEHGSRFKADAHGRTLDGRY